MDTPEQPQIWLDQHEMFHVESPCVGVCTSGAKGFCKGCLRSRIERFHWHEMTENQKYTVVQLCHSRKARILARRRKLENSLLQQDQLVDEADIQLNLF
ncbi:MAG: DUF1289 domain-containing protein [Oceanospirillaceae bacterium]